MSPQLRIEPSMYIVPILHLLIGLVNKVWESLCHFLDEFVELISLEEAELKEQCEEYELHIQSISDEIEILTVNRNFASLEINLNPEALEVYKSLREEIKMLEKEKRKNKMLLRQHKTLLNDLKQKRIGNEESIDTLLYKILDDAKIKRQSFHGGAMNGVCCRRLLDHTDTIFSKIKDLARQRINSNTTRINIITISQVDLVLDKFQELLDTLDVTFSLLRVCDPTEDEIIKIEKTIEELESKWNNLELSHTPKLHILLKHTVEQVRRFGGIADLAEDFVEKAHQIGKRMDHLTARMNSQNYRDKELVKIRRKWLTNDPDVQRQITTVKEASRRHTVKTSLPRKKFKKNLVKQTKMIKRERTFSKIVMK